MVSNITESQLLKKIEKIEEFDTQSWQIFSGTGISVRPGSITKVASEAYLNWMIGLTEENRRWLEGRAEHFHLKDEVNGRESPLDSVTIREKLEPHLLTLTTNVVTEIIGVLNNKTKYLNICILSSARRIGAIISSLAAAVISDKTVGKILRTKTVFSFADPLSEERLKNVISALKTHGLKYNVPVIPERDDHFLARQPPNYFDMIISFLHYHNKPFPTHLSLAHRVLKDDGVLIIADWNSALWHHPENYYVLLKNVGADDRLLSKFIKYFGLAQQPALVTDGLTPQEIKAMMDHLDYWSSIGRAIDITSERERRLFCLSAHITSKQSIKRLNAAGFVTDFDTIRKAFQGELKSINSLPRPILNNSDFANVIVAMKKR